MGSGASRSDPNLGWGIDNVPVEDCEKLTQLIASGLNKQIDIYKSNHPAVSSLTKSRCQLNSSEPNNMVFEPTDLRVKHMVVTVFRFVPFLFYYI